MSSKKERCIEKCVDEITGFHPIQHQRCISECVAAGNGNGGDPKKEIIIKQTEIMDIGVTQWQYQVGIETQAPFTYVPVTEKVYAPIFQVYSPQARADIGVEQEATSTIDLLLKQAMELAAQQKAEIDARQAQEATATISDEETQGALGAMIVLGLLAGGGYIAYKYVDKKSKGGKKKK